MGSLLSLHRLEIHFYQKVVIIILINMEDKLNSTLIWAHICAYMLTQALKKSGNMKLFRFELPILWLHKSWFLSSLWSIQNSLLHLFAMYWLMVQDCCQGCATLMCVNRAIMWSWRCWESISKLLASMREPGAQPEILGPRKRNPTAGY